jgi:hypothetical protein
MGLPAVSVCWNERREARVGLVRASATGQAVSRVHVSAAISMTYWAAAHSWRRWGSPLSLDRSGRWPFFRAWFWTGSWGLRCRGSCCSCYYES